MFAIRSQNFPAINLHKYKCENGGRCSCLHFMAAMFYKGCAVVARETGLGNHREMHRRLILFSGFAVIKCNYLLSWIADTDARAAALFLSFRHLLLALCTYDNPAAVSFVGVKVRLTVVHTYGYGDSLNNTNNADPIVRYIDEQVWYCDQFTFFADFCIFSSNKSICGVHCHCKVAFSFDCYCK